MKRFVVKYDHANSCWGVWDSFDNIFVYHSKKKVECDFEASNRECDID